MHFLSLLTRHFFANNLIRQRTLRLPLPVLPLHFLIHMLQRHLVPSQMQNVNSRPTGRSVLLMLTNNMKVLARLRLLRKVKYHVPWLLINHMLLERGPRRNNQVLLHLAPLCKEAGWTTFLGNSLSQGLSNYTKGQWILSMSLTISISRTECH